VIFNEQDEDMGRSVRMDRIYLHLKKIYTAAEDPFPQDVFALNGASNLFTAMDDFKFTLRALATLSLEKPETPMQSTTEDVLAGDSVDDEEEVSFSFLCAKMCYFVEGEHYFVLCTSLFSFLASLKVILNILEGCILIGLIVLSQAIIGDGITVRSFDEKMFCGHGCSIHLLRLSFRMPSLV
jgi:hypothetical protein